MSALSEVRDQRSEVSDRFSGNTRQVAKKSLQNRTSKIETQKLNVALLTGGDDRPYVLGLVSALTSNGVTVDVIGSDDLELPELLDNSSVNFLNLRGDQSSDANLVWKIVRVLRYYWRLLSYTATARARVFHILWNNKFEFLDRTLLMLYYKLLGKRIVLTAHNVNMRKRDDTDTLLNRWSLRTQYQLSDNIFVHADKMKAELVTEFHLGEDKVRVIPFGINNTVPNTNLSAADAKRSLRISGNDKTILCYGQIAPYKGVEYLVTAFCEILKRDSSYRLIIAGKPKWSEVYWTQIERLIEDLEVGDRIIRRIEHVPDEETELYFKAADVLVLSYTEVFQSGVIFLGYSFGLPAIVADVGSLKEEIIEGETGFVFKPQDSFDLASKIEKYFKSELFHDLKNRRTQIKDYANERYSWSKVTAITIPVYTRLLTSTAANAT